MKKVINEKNLRGSLNVNRLLILGLLLLTSISFAEESGKWESPKSVEGTTTVSVEQAAELFNRGVPFLDVRNQRLFNRKHIPNAIHLDLKNGYSKEALMGLIQPDQEIVIYCSGQKCSRSYRASTLAVHWGYTKIYYFRDGVIGWKTAGLPMTFADGTTRPATAKD